MESLSAEALLLLFQKRPQLAPELLRDALGVEAPPHTEARYESCDLSREDRADVVLLLNGGRPTGAIAVEILLSKNDPSLCGWPARVAGVSERFGCPASLLVVAWSDQVADVGRRALLDMKHAACLHIVAPSTVPMVDDVEVASANPELAVLSALANVRSEAGLGIALAALHASQTLRDERARLYLHLLGVCLDAIARKAFEERRPSASQATRDLAGRSASIRQREEASRSQRSSTDRCNE